MSKTYEDKKNNLAHIQRNLQAMKLAASEFLKKSGNPELPPITKARHYLFHSLYNQVTKPKQKLQQIIQLPKQLDYPSQQLADYSTEGSPILGQSKLFPQEKSQKKCIKKSICGLQIKKTIERQIHEQSWYVKKVAQFHSPIQINNKGVQQQLSLQIRPRKAKTIQKHALCFNTINVNDLIPESDSPVSIGRKKSFQTKRKIETKNQQFLTIKSSRLQNAKSSLDKYQSYNNQKEDSIKKMPNLNQENYNKQIDSNLNEYFKAMKQTFRGSLQLQKDILKKGKKTRKQFLASHYDFKKRSSLQLQYSSLDKMQKNQAQFTPWKVDKQLYKDQELTDLQNSLK